MADSFDDVNPPTIRRLFGDAAMARVLDFLTLYRRFDYSKTEIAETSNVGWKTLFRLWPIIEKYQLVVPTRKVGRAQLYKFNEEAPIAKSLSRLALEIADFDNKTIVEPEVGPLEARTEIQTSRFTLGTKETGNPEMDFLQAERTAAIRMAKPNVTVIGIGGAGSNVVSWIKQRGISGIKLIAANTDIAHLTISKADRKILVGRKLMNGVGAGGNPQRGAEAMMESLSDFQKETQDSDVIFLCAGLGGGAGSGGIVALSKELAKRDHLVIGIVTLPFSVERYRFDTAKNSLKTLVKYCDTVLVIDNTKLAKIAGDLPLQQALGVANELVGRFIKGITETITLSSLVNFDKADLRAMCERKGLAAIGVGEAEGPDRVEIAIRQAIEGQLLDIGDMTKSEGMLVQVTGSSDLTLEEMTSAAELVTKSLPPKVRVVWGARVDPSLKGRVNAMVMRTGVQSSFILQGGDDVSRTSPLRVGSSD